MAPSLTEVGSRYTYKKCGRRGLDNKEWRDVSRAKIEVLHPPSRYNDAETLPKTPSGVHEGAVSATNGAYMFAAASWRARWIAADLRLSCQCLG